MRQSPSARDRRGRDAPAAGGWPKCSGRVLSTSGRQQHVPAGAVSGGQQPTPSPTPWSARARRARDRR